MTPRPAIKEKMSMRNILLVSTALISALFCGGSAQAQITVTLGGYTEFFAGFVDDDQPNRNHRDFELETEVVIQADGKADNGLLYGTKIELQNSGSGGTASGVVVDEASIYLSGSLGRLELGDFGGAADKMKIYGPVVGIEQIDGDYTDFTATGTGFGNQVGFGIHIPHASDSTKAMYRTARFAGFQFGASYAPEKGSESQNVVAFDNALNVGAPKNSAGYENFWEFGANYTGEFSGIGVALGATLSFADSTPTNGTALKDFTAWNVGGKVSYAGLALGGGYVDAGDFGAPAAGPLSGDQSVWHVGASYTAGPLAVGASYADAEGFKAPGIYTPDFKAYGVGMAYTLAPGLILQSDLMFLNEDVVFETAPGNSVSNDGYVWIVGTRLNF
jgi:hypothetical protein